MNLLCPACHTPLPEGAAEPIVTCAACSAEVDVSRAGTQAGLPRFVPEIDRTGMTIGSFHVDALIGGGGMGTVYRASAPDGARVAIKVLAPALGNAPAFVARFAREVEALARLDHPAIVRVLSNGTEAGAPWFAMELVEGPDLKTRLADGPLAPGEIEVIFGRLLDALDHAHARGVVHRDLKPANVLLSAAGAKLADFGIARFEAGALTRSQALTRLTETAVVIGSLPYMSPEQKRGGAVDGRSDLFSVGVMLYEAATGIIPQGAFSPPSQLDARFGRAFDELVMRLLHPEPARRPGTAAEVQRALDRAIRGGRTRVFARRASAAAALTFAALVATLGGWTALRRGGKADGPGSSPPTALGVPADSAMKKQIGSTPSGPAVVDPTPSAPDVLTAALPPDIDDPAGAGSKKKASAPRYRVDVKMSKLRALKAKESQARGSKVAPANGDNGALPAVGATNAGSAPSRKASSRSALQPPAQVPQLLERK